ncbi:MAG: response regulator [Deltaproteobacteria bacterium]|nr:response regulator [Deltaproteobacteria bacterium]
MSTSRAELPAFRPAGRLSAEARHRAIFEGSAEPVLVLEAALDEAGAIVAWRPVEANARARERLGPLGESLLARDLAEVWPDDAARLATLCARVARDGVEERCDVRVSGQRLTLRLARVDASTVTACIEAREPARLGSFADGVEKHWLAALLEATNEEVYFTDTARRYTYANPAALREFEHRALDGVDLADVVSKLEVLRPDGTPRPLAEAPPLRALAGETVRDEEQLVRVPRTRELRHRMVSSAPVRDEEGRIVGSVSVVRDVTEQRLSERAVREREHQLEEADRRKDEFIAMLAHELRNPLVPIRTGVELLKMAGARPDLVATVRPMMERQVAHMVRLIDDLLDVSRITSGKIRLQREPVTLSSVVGSAIEINRDAIGERALELTVSLAEPHRVLDVDPTRFAQVISNLLQNAVKFTPPGGRITIQGRIEHSERARAPELLLEVADSGVGISAEMLPRIFDLFAQDRHSARATQAGLGIGLALARRLVEMHAGTLDALSDGEGRGSRFVIRLPAPLAAGSAVASKEEHPEHGLRGVHVLVIDDNRDAAESLALLVESMGGEARIASDGPSGLDMLGEITPAVVLLDIGMPRMDGYEVCRRIRPRWQRRLGVVALSGWGQERDKLLALEAGFDAHLTKPADPVQLRETIAAVAAARPATSRDPSGERE